MLSIKRRYNPLEKSYVAINFPGVEDTLISTDKYIIPPLFEGKTSKGRSFK